MIETTPMKAYELTQGDIILYQGEELLVYSETRHTRDGIEFDALPLEIEGSETQGIRLGLEEKVEWIGYQKPFDYNQVLSA